MFQESFETAFFSDSRIHIWIQSWNIGAKVLPLLVVCNHRGGEIVHAIPGGPWQRQSTQKGFLGYFGLLSKRKKLQKTEMSFWSGGTKSSVHFCLWVFECGYQGPFPLLSGFMTILQCFKLLWKNHICLCTFMWLCFGFLGTMPHSIFPLQSVSDSLCFLCSFSVEDQQGKKLFFIRIHLNRGLKHFQADF